MKDTPNTPNGAPTVRSYLLAALLFPPRGVRMGWGMKNQPLFVRVLLSALPLVGPISGIFMAVRAFY